MVQKLKKPILWILSFAIVLAAMVVLLPILTAADGGVQVGAFTVINGTQGTDYEYDDSSKVLTIKKNTALTIKNIDPNTETTDNTIVVASENGANITLAGVNINVSETEQACAFKIDSTTADKVTITLADGSENVLTSGKECAGLQKSNGADYELEIKGDTAGTGTLNATGGESGAGIGSGMGKYTNPTIAAVANITISGGKVTATGGDYAAGVGGGENGAGSNITISGNAEVIAKGGNRGAGVGGGDCGEGSNIIISDNAELTATGGIFSAGIGGGNYGKGSNITISGGTVTANGGKSGAGIGGGDSRAGSNIKITGGSVKVTAGSGANAIGGGVEKEAVTPTLADGTTLVYPFTIENTSSETIMIDGLENTLKTHSGSDSNLYVYLPAEKHTIKVGNVTKNYILNSVSKEFAEVSTNLVITADGSAELLYGVDYIYPKDTGILTVLSNKAVTIKNADGVSATIDKIAVASAKGANITLAGVNINVSATMKACAFEIDTATAGDVKITLADGSTNTLISGNSCAGLQKSNADTHNLEITGGTAGTGTLSATGGYDGAGIGGGKSGSGSNITISGGEVTATSSMNGAGIGGGGNNGSGSNITISGGIVTANGGEFGAGIGGGKSGSCSDITISGGIVTANGNNYGAGIGGGYGDKADAGVGAASNITISGGTVTATGGNFGAGIGGGYCGKASNITISGGKVTATGVYKAAGIGGGGFSGTLTDAECCTAFNIKITRGSVKVTAGSGANAIGGGQGKDPVTPTLADGTTLVYPFTIENTSSETIMIDGLENTLKTHSGSDSNLYVYLPAEKHTIKVGNVTKNYILNSVSKEFAEVSTNLVITADGSAELLYGVDYIYPKDTGILTVLSNKAVTIKNADGVSTTTDTIAVASTTGANITLAGVYIDVSNKSEACAFKIDTVTSGDVKITLADGSTNTLISGEKCAGLQKSNGAGYNLEITGGTAGTGTLNATGGKNAAGIGGGYNSSSGSNITISGGTVNATGGAGGAGIGSGFGGNASAITISGGTVTATGSEAAGIGGGLNGAGSDIKISSGKVTAISVGTGAGIGGGNGGAGSDIEISGGTVIANGGKTGAGIGGGCSGTGSEITISGGTVTANGGTTSAGIGGGSNGAGSDIEISGGTVTANGGAGGAGIGGGKFKSGSNITISGGTVKVTRDTSGSYSGAIIGNGATRSADGTAVTPTLADGTTAVYLLELDTTDATAVTINGTDIKPIKHGTESKIYVYLPAKEASDPNVITISKTAGDTTTKLFYNSTTEKWITSVEKPAADTTTEFIYNGNEQTYTLAESDYYTITGNKQTDAGDYTVTVSLDDKDNTAWSDGTTDDLPYTFTIKQAKPEITLATDLTSAIAGATITATASAQNPENAALTDIPEIKLYYKVGDGAETAFTGSFVIPKGTATGTTITVYARTAESQNYKAVEETATVTVTDCNHAHKTDKWTTDGTYHWHICLDCEAVVDKAAHISGGAATVETAETCTICGYEISPKTAYAPIITPNGGSFKGTQEVTITCATEGATIYYTTDGSVPTTASTAYTGAFTLDASAIVKAIAVKDGMGDSAVTTAEFTKSAGSGSGSSGGSSGGSGSGGSGSGSTTTNPEINGTSKSWTAIAAEVAALTNGSTVTINLNGNSTVPVEVMKAIADKNIKATFVVDSWRSWTVDGAKITTPTAITLSAVQVPALDSSSLNGTVGAKLRIDGSNVAQLTLAFKKDYAGKFANVYKLDGDKLVFADVVKVDENGTVTLSEDAKGDYVVMLSDYSDRKGDVSNDGKVDISDASALLKAAFKLADAANAQMLDYNGDGKIDIRDASDLLKDIFNGKIA